MPFIESTDGVRLNIRIEGNESGPTVLLAHSVGCDLSLWDAQVPAIADSYHVVRYDSRGHGRSDAPPGDYTIAQLGADAIGILDAIGIQAAHICGLSLGGTLGQWLAMHAPNRVASLALCDTSARMSTVAGWQSRIDTALEKGMAAMVDLSMTRFFSDRVRTTSPETVERFRRRFITTPAHGYAGCCAVLRDCDFTADLDRIHAPTLVLGGLFDAPAPPADSTYLARGIRGATLVLLDTGHLSAVEDAPAFNKALRDHLDRSDS